MLQTCGLQTRLFLNSSFLFTLLLLTAHALKHRKDYSVLYQWKTLDYKFPSAKARQDSLNNQSFIPLNIVLTSARVWKDRIYFATGRLRPGVPVSLSSATYDPTNTETIIGQKLKPFPNWSMQQLYNCKAFQVVQTIEIDQFGRMWIPDSGRINILTSTPSNVCQPKLVVIDLTTKNKLIVRTHYFPPEVVSPTEGFLDDLVVACHNPENCFAYIPNPLQNTLVIYDFLKNKSWAVSHSTMVPVPEAGSVTANGITFSLAAFGVDGIALSSFDKGFDRLYYSPVASFNMYSVSTRRLRMAPSARTTRLSNVDVTSHGRRHVSQTDGIGTDSGGILYYGRIAYNTLAFWNTNTGLRNSVTDVAYRHSNVDMDYIDGISFDNKGHVILTVNKLGLYVAKGYDPNGNNTRILRTKALNKRSYMFSNF